VSERDDPFATLGLPARRDLTDEDVRSAWRRIAAATHPDRPDGGDPARYSTAAAAYNTLRTSFGRGEALADLGLAGYPAASRAARRGRRRAGNRAQRARIPGVSKRAALSAGPVAAAVIAVAAAGWTPATIGLLVGAATWLLALHTRQP
jgi:curved DNA-binding protein CbpA